MANPESPTLSADASAARKNELAEKLLAPANANPQESEEFLTAIDSLSDEKAAEGLEMLKTDSPVEVMKKVLVVYQIQTL